MMELRSLVASAGLVVAAAAVARAQPVATTQRAANAPSVGALRGTVLVDSLNVPIRDAEVSVPALGLRTLTDSLGTFLLRGVPLGRQVVRVRRLGYESIVTILTFAPNDTLDREFGLASLATKLPEVEVRGSAALIRTGKLSEFDRRRASGFGHFITQAQLEKSEGRLTSDVLRTLPGLKLMRDPRKPTQWYVGNSRGVQSFLRNQDSICMAGIIVDGATVYDGSGDDVEIVNIGGRPVERPVAAEPFNVNSIPPGEIAGIEYYAGAATMPAELNSTRNTCGLLVIWTRIK